MRPEHNRILGLDILRALAIIFVVVGHGVEVLPESNYFRRIIEYFIFDGVGIFFVLSGYLIGSILIRTLSEQDVNIKTLLYFWNRRWFRTLPTYFLILSFIVILALCHQEYIIPPRVYSFYVFLQNFASAHPNFFNEAWSLSVEEWFYIMLPTLLFILLRGLRLNLKTALIIVMSLIIVSVSLLRIYRYLHFPVKSINGWDTYFRKEVITRLDSIMYGVLGAFCMHYYYIIFFRLKKICFYIGLLMILVDKIIITSTSDLFNTPYPYIFSFDMVSIGVLLMIPMLSSVKQNQSYFSKLITKLAIISYSMYLINYSLILKWLIPKLVFGGKTNNTVIALGELSLYIIITTIASVILYQFFEKPITLLRVSDYEYIKRKRIDEI